MDNPADKFRAHFEFYKAGNDFNLEGIRQTTAVGQAALKSASILNAGPAAALLAFIGHLATAEHPAKPLSQTVPHLTVSMGCFLLGLLLSTLAFGAVYVATRLQFGLEAQRIDALLEKKAYQADPKKTWWIRFHDRGAIVLVILSCVCFIVGCCIGAAVFYDFGN